ncbi:methylamine utilization protein [Niveibacterium sp. SC-1]|uniref:methylamine utilization protein n=1 Tax=Niveibacterium sp. SC-1 TaxID=3135646 RepID=UPI003120526D
MNLFPFAALLVALALPAEAADLGISFRDAAGLPLEFAVATATPLGKPAGGKPGKAVIDQVDREFVPYVSVVSVGTEISFPNQDDIRHSVYSFSPAKRFELKLYSGTKATPVVFDKPGVVALGCNIHDWMLAYVYVTEAPYFGRSDARGTLTLKGLDPGEYEVHLWHPDASQGEQVTRLRVEASGTQLSQSFTLKPKSAGAAHQ